MRLAIAGAGAVGRSIARELIANGHQVLLIDAFPPALDFTRCRLRRPVGHVEQHPFEILEWKPYDPVVQGCLDRLAVFIEEAK